MSAICVPQAFARPFLSSGNFGARCDGLRLGSGRSSLFGARKSGTVSFRHQSRELRFASPMAQTPSSGGEEVPFAPVSTSKSAVQEKPAKKDVKYELKSAAGGTYKINPGQQFEVATAGVQAFVRFGSAAFVSPNLAKFRKRPEVPLELYEFEGCPFCRKVREAVSILDLDVIFYPCPADGPTFRPKAKELSGKGQFPFLVDPNTGRSMLESDDIIAYLWDEYGDGKANIPLPLKLGALTTITAGLGLLPRFGRGSRYRKPAYGGSRKLPEEPIILWAYEASPFCKLVREELNELELPHLYKSVARNSAKREEITQKWGGFQVPYIEDPNTGVAMFESHPIIEYLQRTYA